MKRKTLGIISVLIGVLLMADIMGYINVRNIIGMYWPLILIILGIIGFVEDRFASGFNIALVVIGSFLQLDKFDIFYVNVWSLFIPTVLIIFGITMLIGGRNRKIEYEYDDDYYDDEDEIIDEEDSYEDDKAEKPEEMNEKKEDVHTSSNRRNSSKSQSYVGDTSYDDFVDASSILTERTLKNKSQVFKGGKVSGIIGTMIFDLRDANFLNGEALLDVSCMMGNVIILIPDDCRIEVLGSPILGGWRNKKSIDPEKTNQLLRIRATVVLGGLDIE